MSNVAGGFKCPQTSFVMSTGSALVVLVDVQCFYELSAENRRGKLVLQGLDSPVHGLGAHPDLPLVAVCGSSGFLHVWNYELRALHQVRVFEKLVPQVLSFSPCGSLLAVGFSNGVVKILKSHDLSDLASFRDSRDGVTHLTFSSDSAHLATAHMDLCVCLYRFSHRNNDTTYPAEWVGAGKHRSHWKRVVGLIFSLEGEARLFSLGEDRRLVEYDLPRSSEFSGLLIAKTIKVTESSLPTGMMWQRGTVIVSDNASKFRAWNPKDQTCRSTTLAPTEGGHVTQIAGWNNSFAVYSTVDKVVGLVKLPLDGSPSGASGIIAHPGKISAVAVDHKLRYVFTVGGVDLTLNMWAVNTGAIDQHAGKGLARYMPLIEGGADGLFFSEMKDYFDYAQIQSQPADTTRSGKFEGTVPVTALPSLMSALG